MIKNKKLVERLRRFLELEARSCSMDFGCVTPMYGYKMWGAVAIDEIITGLAELKNEAYGYDYR